MARSFDNSTRELETKPWLAYLYGISIVRSKKLHKNIYSGCTSHWDNPSGYHFCS